MTQNIRTLTTAEKTFMESARDESSLLYRPMENMFHVVPSTGKWCVFMWNNLMAVSDTLEEANDTMLKLYNA